MNISLYLFCGGPPRDRAGLPKPLIKIFEGRCLLEHFLMHLTHRRLSLPEVVTLLCDDGQEAEFRTQLKDFTYPVPIRIQECGQQASTFEKFSLALREATDRKSVVQFGYPDIFSFDESPEPQQQALETESMVHISAAALTSRFPRLIVDFYNKKIKGISNYSSPVPANPMHVFGGDLWGRVDYLYALTEEFQSQVGMKAPSLEYDFFFWLINHDKMRCVIQHGDRYWIDSIRDINELLARTRDTQ